MTVTNLATGFNWGPMQVRRICSIEGRRVVELRTEAGKRVTIYVSPTGRSVRVFGAGGEWTAQP